MTPQEMQKTEDRLDVIRRQIGEIPAILNGTLLAKHNRTKHTDGSIHISPAYYTFQYRGSNGKRKWTRIPNSAKAAVERLVRAGERYRTLEREYAALLTECSLNDHGKKNA